MLNVERSGSKIPLGALIFLCGLVGVGIGSLVPRISGTAHACSCSFPGEWRLALVSIEGAGDIGATEFWWDDAATLEGESGGTTLDAGILDVAGELSQ